MSKHKSKNSNLTAMVIHDDLTRLNLLSGLLEREGWDVTAFEGAEAALSGQGLHATPDLIITEIHMAGIDGWRLCRMLRSPDYRPFNDIPVLAVSETFSCEEASRITSDLGAEAFLSSPFDGSRFMQRVRKIFDKEYNRNCPRVLIVEPSGALCNVIKKSFHDRGFTADVSGGMNEAEELFKRNAYDIAVIAHRLPDGSGDMLMACLKMGRPDCIFVITTSDLDRGQTLTWMKMGASAYIHKPFQSDHLVELCINARREQSMIRIGDMLENNTKLLFESEDRLRLTMKAARSGIWEWNLRKDETYWSDEIWELYGLDRKRHAASYDSWIESVKPDDRPALLAGIKDASADGTDLKVEWRVNLPHGRERWLMLRGQPNLNLEGSPDSYRGIVIDITENKKKELEIVEQGKYLEAVLHTAAEGFLMIDAEGKIFDANDAYCRMTGYGPDELKEMHITDIDCFESPPVMKDHMKRIMKNGSDIFETRYLRKDGSLIDMEVSTSYLDAYGGKFINFCRDITERKETESERNIVMALLSAMNKANDLNDLLKTILKMMKEWSGCEAVGIRLKEGADFPYFQSAGFPPEFIRMESSLCSRGTDGKHIVDEKGEPVLECMCGNIIMGRFDPKLPFFTEKGSFWTNSTTDLLASTTEKDRKARTRNRCNREGYESVALIPLHYGEKSLGLLQFNDHRRGMFDRKKISLLERIASNLDMGLAHQRIAQELGKSEERYRTLADFTYDWETWVGPDGSVIYCSPSVSRITGYTAEEIQKDPFLFKSMIHYDDSLNTERHFNFERMDKENKIELDYRIRTKDGEERWLNHYCVPVYDAKMNFLGRRGSTRDITDRKLAEESMRESEEKARSILNSSLAAIVLLDVDGIILDCNEAFTKFIDMDRSHIIGGHLWGIFPEEIVNHRRGSIEDVFKTGESVVLEDNWKGMWHEYRIAPAVKTKEGEVMSIVMEVLDITDRKRSEAERSTLQSQFQQAQKMESVGRLAGGVAHDFNNMLSVIIGNAELALDMMDENQPIFEKLVDIRQAAKRSSDLTRQLLTFARKQTITPRIIHLREAIEGMLKMLRRLIGEDINLEYVACEDLWTVKMDPSQIDQILANLCVNARDAIEGVGRIRIEAGNVYVDEAGCAGIPGFFPGEYVLLSITDNGCGIDKGVIDKVFEPFFTTKELGKGTGLGLATVYGIVKQNNGFIDVESRPGEGSTFRIYLPRHSAKIEKRIEHEGHGLVKGGRETILLVEDDSGILSMVGKILEKAGYTVLAASRPGEAVRLTEAHPGELHLIVTDVIMPEMNGRDLVKKILTFYPGAKRLFMSGYTADVIVHHGVMEEGIHFIQKPFLMNDMVAKVREVLDSE